MTSPAFRERKKRASDGLSMMWIFGLSRRMCSVLMLRLSGLIKRIRSSKDVRLLCSRILLIVECTSEIDGVAICIVISILFVTPIA